MNKQMELNSMIRMFLAVSLMILTLALSSAHGQIPEDSTFIPAGFSDVDALRRALGLSLGASRVYTVEHGFTYAGYGELEYAKYSSDTRTLDSTPDHFVGVPTGKDQELVLARGVVFLGYRFSDRLVFNSEFRADRDLFEHGKATFTSDYLPDDNVSNANVDLAYADYIMSPALTFRAGIVLVPMGTINEFHTPTEYMGARPGLNEIYVIPSIWHALGFGVAGHKWGFDYRAYIVSGLNAAGFTEFGIRNGREITLDTISHPSAVFRIDYNPFPGGVLGGSYYIGNSGIFGLEEPVDLKIHTTLKELHGLFHWKGAHARAQYAKGILHSSPELNATLEKTGKHGVGKRFVGGYVEGGWDFWWYKENGKMIMPYLRGEASNPQDALPPPSLALGLVKNHQLDFIIWIYGLEYRPMRALSIKGEYEHIHDEDDIGWNEFHLDASYTF